MKVKLKEGEAPAEEPKKEEAPAAAPAEGGEPATPEAVAGEVVKAFKSEIESVKAEFKTWQEEQAELSKKRVGLYSPESKADRRVLNDRLRKFMTALFQGDNMMAKDMSEGVNSEGGFLVDTPLNAEIQHLMTEYGVARREMTLTTMASKSLDLTNLATDLAAYWTDEGANKTSDDVAIGRVTLTVNKLAVIVPMTDELLEDSEIDLVSFVTGRIAEQMAKKEDEAFFNGDGTAAFGGFTGMLNNTFTNLYTMTTNSILNVDADDLIGMVDVTPQGALANGKFFMNRTIMSVIRKLKDTTGMYIYQAPSVSGPATVWGFPVINAEAMPGTAADAADTPFILFGDLRKAAWVGVRGGMAVKLADQATVRNTADTADLDLFRRDMTALRVVERVGFVAVVSDAITRLKTSA